MGSGSGGSRRVRGSGSEERRRRRRARATGNTGVRQHGQQSWGITHGASGVNYEIGLAVGGGPPPLSLRWWLYAEASKLTLAGSSGAACQGAVAARYSSVASPLSCQHSTV